MQSRLNRITRKVSGSHLSNFIVLETANKENLRTQTHPEKCNGKYSESELKIKHVLEEYLQLFCILK